MGNYAKPDINICVPASVPITSIVSGVVTDVSWGKPWSGSVTVKLDNPPNSFAQYAAYNFLTKISVMPGQRVNVGTLIGYPGQPVCLAFGLTNATPWGAGYFGRTADPRLDPRTYIAAAQAGKFNTGTGIFSNLSFSTTANTFTAVSDKAHETLNNIPGFEGLVEALDIVEQFQPFNLPNNAGVLGEIPGIGSIIQTMEFPADAMQGLLMFITSNTMAALIRLGIIMIGVLILAALIKNAIQQATVDVTGQTPGQLVGTAAAIVPAAATLMA
jgi:hypothetical protein